MKIAKKAAAVLCAGLMLISPGVVSHQAFGEFPATLTVKAAATEHNISKGNVTINDSEEHIITGSTTEYKVIISGGSPTIRIRNLTIDLSDHGYNQSWRPIDFSSAGGECKLIIEGDNIIKGNGDCPGIMTGSKKLTIDGTGTLKVYGGKAWPGIGAQGGSCNLVIDGGTIEAYGGYRGAGIGGSWSNPGGTVVVNGGKVTAVGGEEASGIGGGYGSSGGTFTINGGEVTAKGNGADDVTGEKKINSGIFNGEDFTPASFTVTIPSTVKLGESVDIKLGDVVVGKDRAIDVKLIKASGKNNTLALSVNGEEIPYAIKKNDENGDEVKVGETVLLATENSNVKLYFTEPTTVPKYTGNYTGTVTFMVKVDAL